MTGTSRSCVSTPRPSRTPDCPGITKVCFHPIYLIHNFTIPYAFSSLGIKNSLKLYDEELERYIPVLMAQARIYWERENYFLVEKLFFQSAEFCSEHEVWKLNVAHVFFMQETKFKDAIR
ncbi:hypothetical protein EON65_06410 [archaeon]|nr:MAG: hypothetical protein EON65_06410 [archaeon]